MATLSPKHDSYSPCYEGGDNYHQGPEWLWVNGCFLICLLHAFKNDPAHHLTLHILLKYLGNHLEHLHTTLWAGLPELTNKNGSFCSRSCGNQAWSNASFIDLLSELDR